MSAFLRGIGHVWSLLVLFSPTVFQYTRFVNVLLRNMMYDEAEQYLNEMVDLPGARDKLIQ